MAGLTKVKGSGIEDGTLSVDDIADDAVTADKLANSINTDIATGPAALPKAGGTMTGTIAGFTSTGIDDNATSTAITINASEDVDFSQNLYIGSAKNTYHKANPTQTDSRYWKIRNDDAFYGDLGFAVSTDNTGSAYTMALELMSDGRGLSQFTAKVWVRFNGMGTVAINDSHNVSSVTDNATGRYTVNFSNALGNSNYSATISAQRYDSNDDGNVPLFGEHKGTNRTRSTTAFPIQTGSWQVGGSNGAGYDATSVNLIIFGD